MKRIHLLLAIFLFVGWANAATYLVQPGGSGAIWSGVPGTVVDLTVQGQSLNAWYNATAITSADQIWIIKGTYILTDSIVTKSSEKIYGGFVGTETTIGARTKGTSAWDFTNETIIDGNALVRGIVSNTGATIDGLSIQNCAYSNTTAGNCAAAVKITTASILQNCIVRNNTITGLTTGFYSGGVYLTTGGKLLNSYVHHNSSANTLGGGNGGGVYVYQLATVDGCTIINNTAYASGGGVQIFGGTGGAVFNNCIISNNTSTNGGGGGVNATNSNAAGGVTFNPSASVTITNCTISSNTAKTDGAGMSLDVANPTATSWNSNLVNITGCTILSNTTSTGNGGGISLSRGQFRITNCSINNNACTAGSVGGGGIHIGYQNGSTLYLANSIVKGNSVAAGKNGAAMHTDAYQTTLRNCLITKNTGPNVISQTGNNSRSWTYQNCTFAANVNATGGETGIYLGYGVQVISTFTNCLFYKCASTPIWGTINAGKDPLVTYCGFDVAIPTTYANKTGCITGITAAAFTDAANGDWSLSPTSAAIDAGTTISAITADIAGTLRPQSTSFDLGAYEALSIISSFTPISGVNRTTITITGKYFTGATAVSFGGIAATSFTVDSDTQITAIVASGASGIVSVTTPGRIGTMPGFTFFDVPTISAFTPTSAASTETVTIAGTNFTGATAVSFGGIAASSFTVNSDTQIFAIVDAGASGSVSVTTPGGTATKTGFTWISGTVVNTTLWKTVRVGGGGAITSIQAHPKVQNLYFITTDVGTPYRWNSTTQSWEGLFYDHPLNYWGLAAAGNIAFDPSDATGNVLYATIGATYATGTILKSIDRGTTWTDCNIPINVVPNSDQGYGQRLAVDPNNSNIVYVTTRPVTTGSGATNGTFKSVDAGQTWTKINNLCGAFLTFDVSGGVTSGVTNNLFIGCADGVYQSTNGGVNFTLMSGSPTNSARGEIHSNGTLYVTHFKSLEKWNGTTWSNVTPSANTAALSAVAVNPNNSDQVIVGNGSYSPYVFDHYISNNGGSSWTKINKVGNLTEVPWFSGGIGGGLKDFCWDPFDQNMVWFTDFFNPFQTTNIWAGSNVTWKARAVGEEETVGIGNLLCPPSGSNLLLSNVADVGGWDHKSLTVSPLVGMLSMFPYSNVAGSVGNMNCTGVAVQETNPNFIARVGRYGWSGKGYAGCSTDGGGTYKIWNCPTGATGGRIAVSATSTTMVWVTQTGSSFRSTDNGTTWTQIASLPSNIIQGTDVFGSGSVFPVAADKVNGNKIYVYSGGKIYVSTDAGATFTAGATITNIVPWYGNPISIETTPGKEGDIWFSINDQGLWHSTDSGASFTKVANVQLAYSVSIGKASPTTPNNPAVYVFGTVNKMYNGLFRSNDNGATWETVSAPLHTGMNIFSMAADRQVYGRVFFNTLGNGIRYVENFVDTQAPTAPTYLVANGTTDTSTRLTWSTSTDNAGVNSYSIYKNGTFIGSSTICSYSVTGLSAGTTYELSVKAKDPAGNLSAPASISVQTQSVYVAPENIALNKRSNADVNGSGAYKANDGNVSTGWSSSDSNPGHWYVVNLGNSYNITGAEIFWGTTDWIYKYRIQVSKDSVTWNTASDKSLNLYYGAPSEINNFTANDCKYIRLTVAGWGSGGFWTAINEFRVFGTLSATGINKLKTSNVRVYPNPATSYLSIENTKPNADVTVLSLNGTIVYSKKTTNSNLIIPLSNWAKGLYVIRVKDDDGVSVEKVIVQ